MASVLRTQPDAQLAIVAERTDPIFDAGFERYSTPVFDAARPFGRHLGGTLDGCVAVVAGLHRVAAEFPDADWFLKIDSDTLWLRKHFIFPTDELADLCLIGSASQGRINGRFPYASGAGYFISRHALLDVFPSPDPQAIEAVLENVNASCGRALSGVPWHEDMTITSAILWRSPGKRRILHDFGAGGLRCHHFQPEVDKDSRPYGVLEIDADFIEFGRPGRIPAGSTEERTGYKRRHMQAWLEHGISYA